MMKKVVVLMSTFNGERFLEEQLNTLSSQEGVEVSLLVRDDGSSDSTQKILDHRKESGSLNWYTGKNLKPARSFLDLLINAPDAEYYAFCDQDDVWLPDKLISAIGRLSKLDKEKPSLYFSAYQMVDSVLIPIETRLKEPKIDLYHALIDNAATGCTIVFNKALLKEARKYVPTYITMHDDWLYLLCLSLGGNVLYDNKSHILYRQHEKNVVGGSKLSFIARIKTRVKKMFLRGNRYRSRLASEIISGYNNDIPEKNREIINTFVNYRKKWYRLSLAFNKNFYHGNSIEANIRIFTMFITGKI